MKFQGFIGTSYTLDSINAESQASISLFPEGISSGFGKEGQIAYLRGSEGLKSVMNVGPGPIRLVHAENLDRSTNDFMTKPVVFVVSGNEVWRFEWDISNGYVGKRLGFLPTSTGVMRAASNKFENAGIFGFNTVFVDGQDNYLYRVNSNQDESAEQFGTFTSFGFNPVQGATHVLWIDGYLIMNKKNTNQFFVGEWQGLTFDPLSFASAEGDPDNIVAIEKNNRDLWLINERSIEIFSNTGNVDFPFERITGAFIEKGCAAPFSVGKIDGTIIWLGREESGQGAVYAAKSLTPQKISTNAIDQEISKYANIEKATAYTYQVEGHLFYVLNFDEATWVYDLSLNAWHQRSYLSEGFLQRHRGEAHDFFAPAGQQLVGDYFNNKVYHLSFNYFDDDGAEIPRIRRCPHLSNDNKRVFYKEMQIDLQGGVGTATLDPVCLMRFSDDGGYVWSNNKSGTMGKIGQYAKRVIFRRLGYSFDRVFEIRITDKCKVAIINATLEVDSE